MAKKNSWRAAREKAKLTQDDVVFKVRTEFGDRDDYYKLTKAKLSRKELDKNAVIPVPVLVFMANLYGQQLEAIDPEAADRARRDLEIYHRWTARDSNPEPTGTGRARSAHGSRSGETPSLEPTGTRRSQHSSAVAREELAESNSVAAA